MILHLLLSFFLSNLESTAAASQACGVVVGLAPHCQKICIDTLLASPTNADQMQQMRPFRSKKGSVKLGDSICIKNGKNRSSSSTIKTNRSPNPGWAARDSLFEFTFTLTSGNRSVSQDTRMAKSASPSSGMFGVVANLDSWSACKKRESCQFSLNFDDAYGGLSGNCQATWIDSSIAPSAKFLFRLDDRSPFPRKIISGNDTLIIRKTLHLPK